jgi:hypothetical protein
LRAIGSIFVSRRFEIVIVSSQGTLPAILSLGRFLFALQQFLEDVVDN